MKPFVIVAALTALISGIILEGSFLHWLIILLIGGYIGAPMVLVMTIWLLMGLKRSRNIPSGLKGTFLLFLITGCALLISLGLGTSIQYWQIREARSYVSLVVPILDSYRKKHGTYPSTLTQIEATHPPKLLSSAHSYSSDSDSFRFEYWDSSGLMDGYYFDSSIRKWNYFD